MERGRGESPRELRRLKGSEAFESNIKTVCRGCEAFVVRGGGCLVSVPDRLSS